MKYVIGARWHRGEDKTPKVHKLPTLLLCKQIPFKHLEIEIIWAKKIIHNKFGIIIWQRIARKNIVLSSVHIDDGRVLLLIIIKWYKYNDNIII
jgi:hypothetical protein